MWWHTGKNIISNLTAYYRSICKIGSRKVDKNVEISVLYNHIWDYHFSGAVIKNEMRNEMEHITDVWSKNEIRVREKGREREKIAKCLLSNERLSMMSKLFALHKNVVCVWNDAVTIVCTAECIVLLARENARLIRTSSIPFCMNTFKGKLIKWMKHLMPSNWP